ncbi:MAG: Crp/Fnr family transcriptional regulator, partial [Acidimicrobiales bacterium]
MLIVERVAVLRNAEMFRGVRDYVLADVAQIVREIDVIPEERFIEEGTADESWMFVLATGKARIHRNAVTLREVGPGSALGEFAVLDPAPRSASVTAVEPGLLFRIDRAPFHEVMLGQPDLMSNIITMLVRLARRNSDSMT